MKRKGLVVAVALLFGAGLTAALSGVGVETAMAEDLKHLLRVDFGTTADWNGQTRITGCIHNDSGRAADHLRLIISRLDAKRHEISRVYSTVDHLLYSDDRAYFDVKVPTSPSYRIDVERVESFQAS
jgi:hypothetical protein